MKPHEEWLFKAEHDLKSARILLTSIDPLYDIAIYHTQQCAEKSLKAVLTFQKKEVDKIHNLKMLIEDCLSDLIQIEEIYDDCIYLSPFSTLYRYPEGDLMPTMDEVKKALEAAERIFNFIADLLK